VSERRYVENEDFAGGYSLLGALLLGAGTEAGSNAIALAARCNFLSARQH
jgi:hypothetical protein